MKSVSVSDVVESTGVKPEERERNLGTNEASPKTRLERVRRGDDISAEISVGLKADSLAER